ncbi:CPS-53 (KpLE1) prophage protein [Escherichia coli]|uniref:CPS-53 (KpLE1) prophage protein n=1 Tax=Escherichia coli TaxID=562 RepID=A0A377A2U9_ECOLX|nr:CPS-53 (KpLE1) prophage protein [Escherichia coli]
MSERMDCLHGQIFLHQHVKKQIASAETKKQQLINQANEYINSNNGQVKHQFGRLKGENWRNIICGWIIWTHWNWSILPVRQILNGLRLRQFRPDDVRRCAGICCRHRVNVIQHSVKSGVFWLRQLPPSLYFS